MLEVSRRNGFSDRNGIKPENTEIQLNNFDKTTRKRIVNFIKQLYYNVYKNIYARSTCPEFTEPIQKFIKFIYREVYNLIIDETKSYEIDQFWENIEDTILQSKYDDILTLIEAIIQYFAKDSWHKA